jgi:hypothetical protein
MPPSWQSQRSRKIQVQIMIHTIRNVSNQGVEEECPSQRIQQCLFELVHFEMLVSDTLLIASDTLNGQNPIFLAQETGIELTVRDNPEEDESNADGQASGNQENDFPGLDAGSVKTCAFCNAISYQTTEDLCESVEREPDTCARALLFLRIPLGSQQGESRRYSSFSDYKGNQLASIANPGLLIHTSKHETYSDSASEVLYCCEGAQSCSP